MHGAEAPKLQPLVLSAIALAWIATFALPFALRLFPGAPVVTTVLEPKHTGNTFPLGNGRFDLVVDAHLPMSSDRQNRQLYYALTMTDGAGASHRYDGELGDRWQTRRLGRRGTAPVHLEHLSTSHEIDSPAGGSLRLDDVTLSGVPNATLSGSFYRHRIPGAAWLLVGGILLGVCALAFDLWWDPRRTPTAALVTATATGAMLVFCSSAAGHPGLRQVFGSTIVGGIGECRRRVSSPGWRDGLRGHARSHPGAQLDTGCDGGREPPGTVRESRRRCQARGQATPANAAGSCGSHSSAPQSSSSWFRVPISIN